MSGTPHTQTAREAYQQHREDIARVMDWIDLELDRHKIKAKAHPADWGYPGELGTIRQKLVETLATLSGNDPQDIENLLSEYR